MAVTSASRWAPRSRRSVSLTSVVLKGVRAAGASKPARPVPPCPVTVTAGKAGALGAGGGGPAASARGEPVAGASAAVAWARAVPADRARPTSTAACTGVKDGCRRGCPAGRERWWSWRAIVIVVRWQVGTSRHGWPGRAPCQHASLREDYLGHRNSPAPRAHRPDRFKGTFSVGRWTRPTPLAKHPTSWRVRTALWRVTHRRSRGRVGRAGTGRHAQQLL